MSMSLSAASENVGEASSTLSTATSFFVGVVGFGAALGLAGALTAGAFYEGVKRIRMRRADRLSRKEATYLGFWLCSSLRHLPFGHSLLGGGLIEVTSITLHAKITLLGIRHR